MNQYFFAVLAAIVVFGVLLVSSFIGIEDQHVLACQAVAQEVSDPSSERFGKVTVFNGKQEKVVRLNFSATTDSGDLSDSKIECAYPVLDEAADPVEYVENPSYVTLNGKLYDASALSRIYTSRSPGRRTAP